MARFHPRTSKTVSESLRESVARRAPIDAELFDLFLTSGVHRAYAERFLSPVQIDKVDVGHIFRKVRFDLKMDG